VKKEEFKEAASKRRHTEHGFGDQKRCV
jgi:hypothetical protein